VDKLNYRKTFLLGFGIFAFTFGTTVYASFVPVFLNVYLEKAWLLGFLMTLDSYFNLFLQPAIGRLSDRTRTRLGRRIPFILVGMPLAAVFMGFIPNAAGLPVLLVSMVLYNLSLSVYRLPATALMPDITAAPLRSKANGVINLMGGLGAALALSAGPLLYRRAAAYPFYLAGLVLLAGPAILFFSIREGRDSLPGATPPERIAPKTAVGYLRGAKAVFPLLIGIFFVYAAYNAVYAFFTLYGSRFLHADVSASAKTMAFFAVSMLAAALPAGFLGSKLGKKKTIVLGLCLLIAVFAAVIVLRRLAAIGCVLIAGGVAWALVIINAYPYVMSMTDAAEAGRYTGLYYVFTSLAAIVSPPLAGALIDRFGYGILFFYVTTCFFLALFFVIVTKPGGKASKSPLQ
jgi:Na+/melibiose symporter-like transporter